MGNGSQETETTQVLVWTLSGIPFHTVLQKVGGHVERFTKLQGNNTNLRNTPLVPGSQGKISLPKIPPIIQPKLLTPI